VNYGTFVPLVGAFSDAGRVVDVAREAERAGWDGFFVSDLVKYGDTPVADACITTAAIASATSTVRLGLVTPVADRRRPWVLARQSAVIDHLSHGRLIFGTGIGFATWHESLASSGRAAREEEDDALSSLFEESLSVLLQCWSGKPVRHEGRWMQVDSGPVLPTPVQRPRMPVWMRAEWPRQSPLRRAAHLDGVMPAFTDQTDNRVLPEAETIRQMRSELRQLGAHKHHDIALRGALGPEWTQASIDRLHELEDAGATWWLEVVSPNEPALAVFERIAAGPPPS
jgi:alkanesulfonate monooxygenase SsuD/methylene tetrahydromethanopterin reductase-like flavin-dependent oxidoreductase (luciferase family)